MTFFVCTCNTHRVELTYLHYGGFCCLAHGLVEVSGGFPVKEKHTLTLTGNVTCSKQHWANTHKYNCDALITCRQVFILKGDTAPLWIKILLHKEIFIFTFTPHVVHFLGLIGVDLPYSDKLATINWNHCLITNFYIFSFILPTFSSFHYIYSLFQE